MNEEGDDIYCASKSNKDDEEQVSNRIHIQIVIGRNNVVIAIVLNLFEQQRKRHNTFTIVTILIIRNRLVRHEFRPDFVKHHAIHHQPYGNSKDNIYRKKFVIFRVHLDPYRICYTFRTFPTTIHRPAFHLQ